MPNWLTGSGVPDKTLEADYYIDTDSKKVYEKLDASWIVNGFVNEYGGMPEEIYKIRKEFNSLNNHLNNLLDFISKGVLNEEDYTVRLTELRKAIEGCVLTLKDTDYNLI